DFTIPLEILKNKETKILYSIISCEDIDFDNNEKFIHCWDGNDFFELTSFKYPEDILKYCTEKDHIMDGMEIVGRKYNLYLCGGEFLPTEIYNKNVWRYSLISKKWFHETTVDIYDTYTGLWTSGADAPFNIHHRYNHCVLDDKLIVCRYLFAEYYKGQRSYENY
ncbi:PREDICTED: uncharacterized protein LOC108747884, partial [Trachymyrmex septentrionalis]|uniref:uncharacterized protein LOC108747884 n=1 Tax=Trachymyrmex septentrionalis TaxID=34720 RepID=UPI00084F5AFF